MNLLDAKVINTVQGLEVYLDLAENIEIKEIRIQTMGIDSPFYEVQFGIEYFLLRKGSYYSSQRNYFRICMNHGFSSITLKETETESLFAVKSEDERAATKKLLGEWLIQTNGYKESINECIKEVKKADVFKGEDIQDKKEIIKFLEKLLRLTTEDIKFASVEKPVQAQILPIC
ncbi:hypothetical protein OH784_25965 [Ectobacillus funiculus]|uniref:hypothetical protein n=1 Tax=Ectobacillus funiculus TaxID=137993 RepID=UPI00397C2D8C